MLKGIPLPSSELVADDALAILSASPVSVSPNGQLSVVDVLYTNGSSQLHAFLLVDLTDGSYLTNYNTIVGLGDETAIKAYKATVSWSTDSTPTVSLSYEDLTDSSSTGLFNRIGSVTSTTLDSADLIEAVSNVVADGSVQKLITDQTGRYFVFETAATNLAPSGTLDTNTISDVYLLDSQNNSLTRISALVDGTEAHEECYLQDIAIIDDKVSVLFSTIASQTFSADDTNSESDLYLWRDGLIQLVSANTNGEAAGYDGGTASFVGNEIAMLATDLIDSDSDGLLDLYLVNTISLSKRIDTTVNALTFAADYDVWIEGGNESTIILGTSGVSQESTDISNQLLEVSISDNTSVILSTTSSGTLANDMSYAPMLNELGNTTLFQTEATNLVASIDSLGFVTTHNNTAPSGELTLTNPVKIGQTVSVDLNSFEDPDGYGSGQTYSWSVDNVLQTSSTENTFTLTSQMEGKALSVTVSYTDNWGVSESITLGTPVSIESLGVQIQLNGKTINHGAITAILDSNASDINSTSSYFNLPGNAIGTISLSDEMYTSDIGISDVIATLRHIVGLSSLSGKPAIAADVNNDSTIGISDVIAQLRHIVGLSKIDTFDVVNANGDVVGNTLQNQTSIELVLNGDVDLSTELQPLFYDL